MINIGIFSVLVKKFVIVKLKRIILVGVCSFFELRNMMKINVFMIIIIDVIGISFVMVVIFVFDNGLGVVWFFCDVMLFIFCCYVLIYQIVVFFKLINVFSLFNVFFNGGLLNIFSEINYG